MNEVGRERQGEAQAVASAPNEDAEKARTQGAEQEEELVLPAQQLARRAKEVGGYRTDDMVGALCATQVVGDIVNDVRQVLGAKATQDLRKLDAEEGYGATLRQWYGGRAESREEGQDKAIAQALRSPEGLDAVMVALEEIKVAGGGVSTPDTLWCAIALGGADAADAGRALRKARAAVWSRKQERGTIEDDKGVAAAHIAQVLVAKHGECEAIMDALEAAEPGWPGPEPALARIAQQAVAEPGEGATRVLEALGQRGAIAGGDERGTTLAMAAARHARNGAEVLAAAIARTKAEGRTLDVRNDAGRTAAHEALRAEAPAAALRTLIEAGADVRIQDAEGDDVVHGARRRRILLPQGDVPKAEELRRCEAMAEAARQALEASGAQAPAGRARRRGGVFKVARRAPSTPAG